MHSMMIFNHMQQRTILTSRMLAVMRSTLLALLLLCTAICRTSGAPASVNGAGQQVPFSTVLPAAAPSASVPVSSFRSHPYPSNIPKLRFTRRNDTDDKDPSFKVMVVTDTHLLDDQTVPGNASNVARASAEAVEQLLAFERPNFVVHLGDLISGEAANATSDVRQAIAQILRPMISTQTPFATTKGNHDNDKYSTHGSITRIEHAIAQGYSYTRIAPPGVGGGDVGTDNYWVPIFGAKDDEQETVDEKGERPEMLLWFFDSRSGKSTLHADGTQTAVDQWVDESVARWIDTETRAMQTAWQGDVPPGLVFVHVPIGDLYDVQLNDPYSDQVGGVLDETSGNFTSLNKTYPGLNDDVGLDTQRSGKDRAFLQALFQSPARRIRAITSGHDHGADWCAPSTINKTTTDYIPLCFAKHTGYGGYDYDNWNHGSRIFTATPQSINSGVQTYIRFQTGEVRYKTTLDAAWSQSAKSSAAATL